MTFDDLDGALRSLQAHDADKERVERTRRACHAALARQRVERTFQPLAWLEPSAATALGGLYLAAAVQLSVAFLRAFRM